MPRLPDTLTPGQKKLAVANHWTFYALLIGLPLGGYLMVNAGGYPVPFFAWELPMVIGKNEGLSSAIFYIHVGGAILLIALILLHVAAALRHEFVLKDNTLRRMTPLPERSPVYAPEAGRERVTGGHRL